MCYLSRRHAGIYYVQVRIRCGARSRLVRYSLATTDYHRARTELFRHLPWLLPMQTADRAAALAAIADNARAVIRTGPTKDPREIGYRQNLLRAGWLYVMDWIGSDPDPVGERDAFLQHDDTRLTLLALRFMNREDARRAGVPFLDVADARPTAHGRLDYLFSDPPQLAVARASGRVRAIVPPEMYAPEIFPSVPPDEVELRPGEIPIDRLYVNDDGRPIQLKGGLASIDGDVATQWNGRFTAAQRADWQAPYGYWNDPEPDAYGRRDVEGLPDDARPEAFSPDQDIDNERDTASTLLDVQVTAIDQDDDVTAAEGIRVAGATATAVLPAAHAASLDVPPGGGLSLAKACRRFLDDRRTRHGDDRAEEDAGLIFAFMLAVIGADLPLTDLTPEHFAAVENAIAMLPDVDNIPQPHRSSLFGRYTYARERGFDGLKRLSRTRIKHYHGILGGLFKHLRQKLLYRGEIYGFTLVPDEALEAVERDAWTDEELVRLFGLPLFTGSRSHTRFWQPGTEFVQNEIYWAYVLIFTTGMRPSEIGVLRVEDVVEQKGRWWFTLFGTPASGRKGKTRAARRRIPIDRILLDLGLLDRVNDLKAIGEARLFPEWRTYVHKKSGRPMPGHHFSKSWQYVKKNELGFDREGLTLYGGRHTKASWLDALDFPQRIRDRQLGHAAKNVPGVYGARDLTEREAELLASRELPIQVQIGDLLMAAKIAADEGRLRRVKTWVPAIGRKST